MRRRRVDVINPTRTRPYPSSPIFMNENSSKLSFTIVRCWLLIGQHTLFTLKIIGKILSWWLNVDMIASIYVTEVQVRGIPKYCSLVIKSLSEIMLRNGFKNFDDRRITKPKQSLISVWILNWFIFIKTEKSSNTCHQSSHLHVHLHLTDALWYDGQSNRGFPL